MNMPRLIIYDDGQGGFGPVTTLRPIFLTRSGALTGFERIGRRLGLQAEAVWVPNRLAGVTKALLPGCSVNQAPAEGADCLLVNGRWLGLAYLEQVVGLDKQQALVQGDGQVVAKRVDGRDAARFLQDGCARLLDHVSTIRLIERVLLERPWHILDQLNTTLSADLEAIDLPTLDTDQHPAVTVFGQHAAKTAADAQLSPGIVIDGERGPVVIDRGAQVHPLAVLQGPCYVGPDSSVMPHACIRPNTVIGPGCKVGGEVSASIIQGFSNKSHEGYLGDSLVGAWVNLGAGTNTSNLKNTYGPVRAQLDDGGVPVNSGRTFLGSIIGDYVRTAIATRLATGSVIHTGCMIAGDTWAPKYAKALGFYTPDGRQPYDPAKLIATIRTAMARRDQTLSDAERDLILQLAEAG